METMSTANAVHYVWGDGCDGWHLVNRPELSVIRERMPPGTHEVRHLHLRARQFFWILAGSATLTVDGATIVLSPNEGLEIAPGTPHQMRNAGSADLEFLVISQPHSHGDRQLVP